MLADYRDRTTLGRVLLLSSLALLIVGSTCLADEEKAETEYKDEFMEQINESFKGDLIKNKIVEFIDYIPRSDESNTKVNKVLRAYSIKASHKSGGHVRSNRISAILGKLLQHKIEKCKEHCKCPKPDYIRCPERVCPEIPIGGCAGPPTKCQAPCKIISHPVECENPPRPPPEPPVIIPGDPSDGENITPGNTTMTSTTVKPGSSMTTTKPNSSTSTTKPSGSKSTTKPSSSTSTTKPNSSTSTTKPSSSTSTTKPNGSTSTTKPNSKTSTTKSSKVTSTTKPNSSTSTTKPNSSTSTTKSSESAMTTSKTSRGRKHSHETWRSQLEEELKSEKLFGVKYYNINMKQLEPNSTLRQEIDDIFKSIPDKALRNGKMLKDLDDILNYFDDKPKVELKKRFRGKNRLTKTMLQALVDRITAVIGHIVELHKLKTCKCSTMHCPVDIGQCGYACPNARCCNFYECKCRHY